MTATAMRGGAAVKVILVLALLGVALAGSVLWMVVKRPLNVDAWVSRMALGRAGLERTRVATSFGAQTVFEGGSGPVMVLLHGAGDQAGAWARVVPGIVGRYRLVIPDLAGHGGSAPGDGPITVEQILEGLRAVLDERVGNEPAILVGNSLGAWMAMVIAIERPDEVDRILAVNGGPIRGDEDGSVLFPATREEAGRLMNRLTGPATLPVPGWVLDDVVRNARVGPLGRFGRGAVTMESYVLDGRLHEIAAPVDLLWGEADEVMPLTYAEKVMAGLPAARLHVIRGCGHVPQRECPDRFLEAFDEAMAGRPTAEPALELVPEPES